LLGDSFPFGETLDKSLYNAVVPYQCEIGRGGRLLYDGMGVLIYKHAKLGEDIVIGSGVTIGGRGSTRVPRIGNNVYLATGAKVLGDVTLGDYVFVGANAVVLHSVPSFSIVTGVPAKLIRGGITVDQFRAL